MKSNLEMAVCLIVLAILAFAVILLNVNEMKQEMQHTIERQESIIEMQKWQLENLEPSNDK